jgi:peptide/nickel transport system ATP-binding protein
MAESLDVAGAVLRVEDLHVRFHTSAGLIPAVAGASWTLGAGETLAVVGGSGSGKTATALAVMGLLPKPPACIATGRVLFKGRDLLRCGIDELRRLRGAEVSMVFQDPLSSLNPVFTVGDQIAGVVRAHQPMARGAAWRRAVELLADVRIPHPRQRAHAYPHQLSGGMQQRAMIAMAMAHDPAVLLADEPTTALDVTVQAQILELLARLQADRGTAIVLITHDLGLVAGYADRVVVMHAGRVVEAGDAHAVFHRPQDAYTASHLGSLPGLDRTRSRLPRSPSRPAPPAVLEVEDLVKRYPFKSAEIVGRRKGEIRAVDGVSFAVGRGETLALVGESGAGKTTVARSVLRLVAPTAGVVRFEGEDITRAKPARMRALRAQMQIVFQDAYGSVDPRMTVGRILREPFRIHGRPEDGRVAELLDVVGLGPEHAGRYPHELSSGQRQRVGIARAVALDPKLVVYDEAVSLLDVSLQAQILKLLVDLQARLALAYLFIAHDLRVVRQVAHRVAVMYGGVIVEMGDAPDLFERPAHPYTRALLAAVPVTDPERARWPARATSPADVPSSPGRAGGCRYRARCAVFASDLTDAERRRCVEEAPELAAPAGRAMAACHYPGAPSLP